MSTGTTSARLYEVESFNIDAVQYVVDEFVPPVLVPAPDTPNNFRSINVTETTVELAWDAQEGVDNFVIEYGTDGFTFPNSVQVDGSLSTFTVESLTGGTEYFFRIKAVNEGGESAFSNIASATTESGDFALTVDTTLAGTASDTIEIFVSLATNATINWGDGNSDPAVVGTNSHTYLSGGIYQITISGDDIELDMEGQTDALKLIDTVNWGIFNFVSASIFRGCTNLTATTATDAPKLISTLSSVFTNSGILGNSSWNNWDLSNCNSLNETFQQTSFNQPLNDWNVSNVTTLRLCFFLNSAFNQNIEDWDISNVTSLNGAFWNATAFNQNLSLWDYSSVTNMAAFLDNSGLNTANYDALLISWDAQTIPLSTFNIGVSGLTYTLGGAAETARTNLIGKGWVFIGDSGI
jgi:hypothetical protein